MNLRCAAGAIPFLSANKPGQMVDEKPGQKTGPVTHGHAAEEGDDQVHDAHVEGELPFIDGPVRPVRLQQQGGGDNRIDGRKRNLGKSRRQQ